MLSRELKMARSSFATLARARPAKATPTQPSTLPTHSTVPSYSSGKRSRRYHHQYVFNFYVLFLVAVVTTVTPYPPRSSTNIEGTALLPAGPPTACPPSGWMETMFLPSTMQPRWKINFNSSYMRSTQIRSLSSILLKQAAKDICLRENRPVLIEAMTYRIGHHSTSDDRYTNDL